MSVMTDADCAMLKREVSAVSGVSEDDLECRTCPGCGALMVGQIGSEPQRCISCHLDKLYGPMPKGNA
jgi:hypothetical protein